MPTAIYGHSSQINKKGKKIYLGALIHGQTSSGIYIDSKYQSTLHLLPEGIKTPLDLLTKKEIIEAAIENNMMLKGYWWNINREPKPFDTFDAFSSYLGEGDIQKGYERFYMLLKEEVKSLTEKILIALRFSNRKGELEWQAFSLLKVKYGNIPIIGKFDIDNFKEVILNYEIKAIYSEPIVDSDYHRRNSIRAKRDVLKEKKINIVGCGALGGEIADCLTKAGIGSLNLIDKEEFRAHNSIRHIVGIDKIGIPKVYAVNEILMMHNPFIKVNMMLPVNILHYNVNTYLLDDSISISSIADDNIEGYLNEQAIIYNKVIFYSRALRGGKIARIFRVIPGIDACMNCLSLYYKEKDSRFIHIPEDQTLPIITNECNNPIRPASAADLKLISSISSRLIIDFLQNGDTSKNHWIWATEKIDGLRFDEITPFILHSSFIPNTRE